MKPMTLWALTAMAAVVSPVQTPLHATTPDPCDHSPSHVFFVNDPTHRNSVVFKSTAPLEDVVGTTAHITGYMVFDPGSPESGGHGIFTVPVASLETGIPLRDQHVKGEGWLDAATYPDILFKITELKGLVPHAGAAGSRTFDLIALGEFTLHGVSREISVPARISHLPATEQTAKRLPGDLLAARAAFVVTLADYGITGPAGMGLIGSKVGETITVEVSVMGSTGSAAPAVYPCSSQPSTPK